MIGTGGDADDLATALRRAGVADVTSDADLASLTTLRVGGRARVLVVADHDAELRAIGVVAAAEGVPTVVIGRGSNLLVADAGWSGIAIVLGRGYRGISIDGTTVDVGAAEPLPVLATVAADAGLGGFAWGCAVPGTVGGAVRMNAGAHGHDMSEHLIDVEVLRLSSGARETWPVATLGLRYRGSDLPSDAVVVGARLRLEPAPAEVVRAEMSEIRRWRRTHQPLSQPNCGSVFTNPPGTSAGALIEAAGLKGASVGGATVSDRHANFIVTASGTTAADVAGLIEHVRSVVRERAGIDLETEVMWLGWDGAA